MSIVVLEKNPRVGKKLLASGNGRCNLTNQRIRAACYHGDVSDGMRLLSVYPPQAVVEFFQSMGVLCREEEEGRTYPYNGQASAVLAVSYTHLDVYKRQGKKRGCRLHY